MTQLNSAMTTLPCVGIHLDDLVLAGALPAALAGTWKLSAHPTGATVLGFAARPPLSDEVEEEGPHDPADDDEEDEDEDDEEEEEEEEDGEEDEEEEEDEESDDDDGDEDEEDEDEDDEEEEEEEEEEEKK